MKLNSIASKSGNVLMVALLTITVMTLICAISLHVASQNTNTAMQTASWQQALTGAESALDQAINALNLDAAGTAGAWTNWMTVTSSTLPTTQPSGGSSATAKPSPSPSASYNYLIPAAISLSGEGNNSVTSWVTVDTGGMDKNQDTNHLQWYRIRATGVATAPPIARVSANRLDDNLRNTLGLRFNRKTGATITGTGTNLSQVTRSIEVILQPLSSSIWVRGITESNSINLSGGSTVIDSFDSSDPFKSSTIGGLAGQYDATKRQSHGDVATLNSSGSDFRNTNVYGSVAYSGSAIPNTGNVHGTISTPYNTAIPPVSAPSWASGTYTTYSGGGSNPPNSGTFNAGTKNNPTYIKVNGDLVVSSSGNPLHIVQHDSSGNAASPGDQIYIWVTGKLTTQGSGYIQQDSNVQVTLYVGDDITVSGSSYQNLGGLAKDLTIYGYGNTGDKVTVSSGTSNFIGAIEAPKYSTTISGGADYVGAIISHDLTISGGSSFHYDESLNKGSNATVGNYAFASWFEDNSDAARGITY